MSSFSQTLRNWRKSRRFSQLELALEADVSVRHVAFLETGKAMPSPAMIDKLGNALDLPLAARNQMLTQAGFAPRFAGRRMDAAEMQPVQAAVTRMLERHAPYPAIAVDRLWTVVGLNAMAAFLFGKLGILTGGSLLNLMLSPALPEVIENWPEVAHHAAQRLRTESAAQGGVDELDRVADRLSAVPGAPRSSSGPVIPTIYRMGDIRLSLFAMIAQFGTPEDLTLDEFKIELYFPADAETEASLNALAAMIGAG